MPISCILKSRTEAEDNQKNTSVFQKFIYSHFTASIRFLSKDTVNNKDDVFTLASIHLTDDVIVLPLRYIVIIQPTESVVNSMYAIRRAAGAVTRWCRFTYVTL